MPSPGTCPRASRSILRAGCCWIVGMLFPLLSFGIRFIAQLQAILCPDSKDRTHLPLEWLAGHVPRELIVDRDILDPLVFGTNPCVGPRNQLFLSDRRTILQHNGGNRYFTPFRIRHAENSGLAHRWMAYEQLFDVPRVNVDAARDDHVLDPIDQE